MKNTIKRKWIVTFLISTAFYFWFLAPAEAKVYMQVGLLSEPKNMNPFGATDTWTRKINGLIYQPLYRLDPDTANLIPWLAKDEPEYDPHAKALTIHLRETQWDDGTEFTADDVVFTAEAFKRFRIPGYYSYWKFVRHIEALDKYTVKMTLDRPMAVLFTRTLTSLIVQKKKWEPVIRNAERMLAPLSKLQSADREGAMEKALQMAQQVIRKHKVRRPIGLGPFRFEERKRGAFILLVKNERFFGSGKVIAGRKLGPYIDRLIFRVYDKLGTATMALQRGEIDFLWKAVNQAFVNDLVLDTKVSVPMTLGRGYRYLGFNLRRSPMSDLAFRQAVAFLVDKGYLVKRILHDHGQRIDSMVPPSNVFYYNSETPVYGKGMGRLQRTSRAYNILKAAGYRWERPPIDGGGGLQRGKGLLLPNGNPVPVLHLMTPTAEYDTEMAAAGRAIKEWLADFGIPVVWTSMPFKALINKIRTQRDFDMFLMGWKNLSPDPDYLRRFFHSSYNFTNQRNDTGYHSKEFDQRSELQAETINFVNRRRLVLDLQIQLMNDIPYIPLYIPHLMEGIRIDRFVGWTMQYGGVGNIWTFCLLRPTKSWNETHRLHK